MKVYIILFDWSTTDNEAVEVELFDTYEKAVTCFNKTIENEKNHDMSWVGAIALDENGNISDDYELDTNLDAEDKLELWWNVTNKNDWNQHIFLDLRIAEVK